MTEMALSSTTAVSPKSGLYVFGAVILNMVGNSIYYLLGSSALCMVFCMAGLIAFIIGLMLEPTSHLRQMDGMISFLFKLLLLIQGGIIVFGLFSGNALSSMSFPGKLYYLFCCNFYLIAFLSPLAIYIKFDHSLLVFLQKLSFFIGICYIILMIVFFKQLFADYSEANSIAYYTDYGRAIGIRLLVAQFNQFGLLNCILLSFFPYTTRRVFHMNLVIWGGCLILALISAGRGATFTILTFMVSCMILYITSGKHKFSDGRLFLTGLLVSVALFTFIEYASSWFPYLMERGLADSRSQIEETMIYDFNQTPMDWVIGRGLNATYYCPLFPDLSPDRASMETGYLYMILRGGIIYLACFVLILWYTFIRGFFQSQNSACRGIALLALWRLLLLYPFGLPSFSIFDVFLWILIGFCAQKQNRQRSEEEMFALLTQPDSCSDHAKYAIRN